MTWYEERPWKKIGILCVILTMIIVPITFFVDSQIKVVDFSNIKMYDRDMNEIDGITFNSSDYSMDVKWFYVKNTGITKTTIVPEYTPKYDNATIEVQMFVFIAEDVLSEDNVLEVGEIAYCKATFTRLYVEDFVPIQLIMRSS